MSPLVSRAQIDGEAELGAGSGPHLYPAAEGNVGNLIEDALNGETDRVLDKRHNRF